MGLLSLQSLRCLGEEEEEHQVGAIDLKLRRFTASANPPAAKLTAPHAPHWLPCTIHSLP